MTEYLKLKSPYKNFDFVILIAAIILVLIGLSTIQSTVVAVSSEHSILTSKLLNTQILSITSALIIFIVVTLFNYRYLLYLSPLFYLIVLGALGSVLFWSSNSRGVARWFSLGSVNVQPSTFSAILLIIVFAATFAFLKDKINNYFNLLISILVAAAPAFLIVIEPDLGLTVIVIFCWFAMLHFTPIKVSRIASIYLVILISVPLIWMNMADYQKARVTSFINPESDPLGSGYNVIQSEIAVGSGQILGRGWGRGSQSHLQFLPEQHTDFVFATFAEEQGFVGSVIILFLYIVIIWRGLTIATTASDYFGQLVAIGIVVWLTAHVFVNIAMNIGLAPITGIPLPFLSYGGSSMLAVFIALGLLESIAVHRLDTRQ